MKSTLTTLKNNLRQRTGMILLFSYGIIAGTSAPILLSRCATGGSSCTTCGGACGLALGIVPLVLFFTTKSRAKKVGQNILSMVRKTGREKVE
jgi:hypothetical protein